MPLVKMVLNTSIDADKRNALAKASASAVASALGKPEAYMMAVVEADAAVVLGGDDSPAAFFDVRSIGEISSEQAKSISAELAQLLQQHADISSARVYGNFAGWSGSMWAHNGTTF